MSHWPRIVHIECATPRLYRWFCSQLTNIATHTPHGFIVIDESRWAARLSAAEGREV